MRIAQYITPHRIAGAEVHFMHLAEHLGQRGHRVTVICPRGRRLTRELEARGLHPFAPRTFGKLDPLMVCRLARLLQRRRIQVLHTHLSTASLLGSIAGRIARVPVVSTVHGLNKKTFFVLANRLIAVSQAVKSHLEAQGVAGDKITFVQHGVPAPPRLGEGRRAALRSELGVPEGAFLIGSVGRLDLQKGHAALIEAAAILACDASLPPVYALIVGEGRLREQLERQALESRAGGRVVLTGFREDAALLAGAMDVFVFPSLWEPLGLAPVEAMAQEVPVVASRVGGIPEVVIDGETGILVPPGDARGIATAVKRLLCDGDLRARMAQAGLRRAREQFSIERMSREIEGIYQALIAGCPPVGRDANEKNRGTG